MPFDPKQKELQERIYNSFKSNNPDVPSIDSFYNEIDSNSKFREDFYNVFKSRNPDVPAIDGFYNELGYSEQKKENNLPSFTANINPETLTSEIKYELPEVQETVYEIPKKYTDTQINLTELNPVLKGFANKMRAANELFDRDYASLDEIDQNVLDEQEKAWIKEYNQPNKDEARINNERARIEKLRETQGIDDSQIIQAENDLKERIDNGEFDLKDTDEDKQRKLKNFKDYVAQQRILGAQITEGRNRLKPKLEELRKQNRATQERIDRSFGLLSGTEEAGMARLSEAYQTQTTPEVVAENLYNEAAKILAKPNKYDNSNGLSNFLNASGGKIGNYVMSSMGLQDFLKLPAIRLAADELIKNNYDPTKLSEANQEIFRGLMAVADAEALRKNNTATSTKAGEIAGDSLIFMSQFLEWGGLTKNAAQTVSKNLIKAFAIPGSKRTIGRALRKGAANLAETGIRFGDAIAMQSIQPQMMADNLSLEDNIYRDKDGKIVVEDNNFLGSLLNNAYENFSERGGSFKTIRRGSGIDKLLTKPYKSKGAEAVRGAITNNLSKLRNSTFGKFLNQGGVQPLSEFMEEVDNGTKDVVVGRASFEDFFNGENIKTLALGFLPMTLVGVGGMALSTRNTKHQLQNSESNLNLALDELGFSEQEISRAKSDINNGNTAEVFNTAERKIRVGQQNGTLTNEQTERLSKELAQNIFDYAVKFERQKQISSESVKEQIESDFDNRNFKNRAIVNNDGNIYEVSFKDDNGNSIESPKEFIIGAAPQLSNDGTITPNNWVWTYNPETRERKLRPTKNVTIEQTIFPIDKDINANFTESEQREIDENPFEFIRKNPKKETAVLQRELAKLNNDIKGQQNSPKGRILSYNRYVDFLTNDEDGKVHQVKITDEDGLDNYLFVLSDNQDDTSFVFNQNKGTIEKIDSKDLPNREVFTPLEIKRANSNQILEELQTEQNNQDSGDIADIELARQNEELSNVRTINEELAQPTPEEIEKEQTFQNMVAAFNEWFELRAIDQDTIAEWKDGDDTYYIKASTNGADGTNSATVVLDEAGNKIVVSASRINEDDVTVKTAQQAFVEFAQNYSQISNENPATAEMPIAENGAENAPENAEINNEVAQIQNETGTVPEQPTPQAEEQRLAAIAESAPKQKNGEIDYNALLNENPQDFVELFESVMGEEEAKAEIQNALNATNKAITSKQNSLKTTTDLNKKVQLKKEISDLQTKKSTYEDIMENHYNAMTARRLAEQRKAEMDEAARVMREEAAQGQKTTEQTEIEPIGRGDFGDIYIQFVGRPQEAIDFLLQKKDGEALGALSHKDIGAIDLVWGYEGTNKSDGYGLAKIAKYHPEVLSDLQGIISDMKITQRTNNRINLESDKYKAAIRLEWDSKKKTWLLTAFEKKTPASTNSRTDVVSNQNGEQNGTATLLNTGVSNDKGTKKSSNKKINGYNQEPTTPEEAALQALATGKVRWTDRLGQGGTVTSRGAGELFRYSNQERRAHFGMIDNQNGKTLEEIAEDIWNYFNTDGNNPYSMQEIRAAVDEAFSSVNSQKQARELLESRYTEQAQQSREQEYQQRELAQREEQGEQYETAPITAEEIAAEERIIPMALEVLFRDSENNPNFANVRSWNISDLIELVQMLESNGAFEAQGLTAQDVQDIYNYLNSEYDLAQQIISNQIADEQNRISGIDDTNSQEYNTGRPKQSESTIGRAGANANVQSGSAAGRVEENSGRESQRSSERESQVSDDVREILSSINLDRSEYGFRELVEANDGSTIDNIELVTDIEEINGELVGEVAVTGLNADGTPYRNVHEVVFNSLPINTNKNITFVENKENGNSYLSNRGADYGTNNLDNSAAVQQQGISNGNAIFGNSVVDVWNRVKHLNFTGGQKVTSSADVANIMRLLESKSVEHLFAVYVNENGTANIQLLSIGTVRNTPGNPNAILAGINKFNPTKIYLVHNHPTGETSPSKEDVSLTASLIRGLNNPNISVGHIIMDTYKKQYSVLENFNQGYYELGTTRRDETLPMDKDYKTEITDEQKVLSAPIKQVLNSNDVANVIKSFRFSAVPKNAVLLLNNRNEIVGNHLLQGETIDYNELLNIIGSNTQTTRIILYGNNNEVEAVNDIKQRLTNLNIDLADYIIVNQTSPDVRAYYQSAGDLGLLRETEVKYKTNENVNRVRLFGANHGSPHSFDKFNLAKIGTGEGNQAYGWGLYFTDKESIARSYANPEWTTNVYVNSKQFNANDFGENSYIANRAVDIFKDYGGKTAQAKQHIKNEINANNNAIKTGKIFNLDTSADETEKETYEQILEFLENNNIEYKKSNIYKVKIHGDKTVNELNFIRWDKPIIEKQKGQIVKGLRELKKDKSGYEDLELDNRDIDTYIDQIKTDYNGDVIYGNIASLLGSQEAASKFLLANGIDGIQYPTEYQSDQTDRGTYNYVVFDDNAIEIVETIRFNAALDRVNEQFNNELQNLTPENANSVIFDLGRPSATLRSTGIADKPFKLYGNKVISKAKKHGFNPTDLTDLPRAIENPIAIFEGSEKGSHAILTELKIGDNNVLVAVNVGKNNDVDFNVVSSTYGKNPAHVIDWINKGKLLFSDKEKTLNYLRISAPIAEAQNNSEFGTKIQKEIETAIEKVNNFENPKTNFDTGSGNRGQISARVGKWFTKKLNAGARSPFVAFDEATGKKWLQEAGLSAEDTNDFVSDIESGNAPRFSTYYNINGKKVRISDHEPNYSMDKFRGANDIELYTENPITHKAMNIDQQVTNLFERDELDESDLLEMYNEGIIKRSTLVENGIIPPKSESSEILQKSKKTIDEWFANAENNKELIEDLRKYPKFFASIKLTKKQTESFVKYVEKKLAEYDAKNNIRLLTTSDGTTVYGFTMPDGRVWIDEKNMNWETPVHEFGHLWNTTIQKENPELWARGVELAKQTPLWNEIKNNPAYANLQTDDQIADEVLARMYGNRADEVIDGIRNSDKSVFEKLSLMGQLRKWIRDVTNWIAKHLGIRNKTAEEIQKMSLRDFIDGAVADQLNGQINLENSEKNSNFVKNKNDERNETRLDNAGTMGSRALRELVEKTERGRRVYQAISEASVQSRTNQGAGNTAWSKDRFLAALEIEARKNGAWIEDIHEIAGEPIGKGQESEVYATPDGRKVIKVNNLSLLTEDFDTFIDRLNAHNQIFTNVPYKIIGVSENSLGEVSIVLEQPFVPATRQATQFEIDQFLKDRGFWLTKTRSNGMGFTNGKFEIWDAEPRNVLADDNGNLYFIDTVIQSLPQEESKSVRLSAENNNSSETETPRPKPAPKDYPNIVEFIHALAEWQRENQTARAEQLDNNRFSTEYSRIKAFMSEGRKTANEKATAISNFINIFTKGTKNNSGAEITKILADVTKATTTTQFEDVLRRAANNMLNSRIKKANSLIKKASQAKVKTDNKGKKTGENSIFFETFKRYQGQDVDYDRLIDTLINQKTSPTADNKDIDEKINAILLAQQYNENVLPTIATIREIEDELEQNENNLKGKTGAERKLLKEERKALEEELILEKMNLVKALAETARGLEEAHEAANTETKIWRQNKRIQKEEVLHDAFRDLKPIGKEAAKDNFIKEAMRALNSPTQSFNQMLLRLGINSADGKGYLYNRFVPQIIEAEQNQFVNYTNDVVTLAKKAAEIFGYKSKTTEKIFKNLYEELGKELRFRLKTDKIKARNLTQGQALSIYLWSRQAQGQTKLLKMGINEDIINEIKSQLNPKVIEFGDWITDVFLPEQRQRYAQVYKQSFGTNMSEIEHYFPLRISQEEIEDKGLSQNQNKVNEVGFDVGSIKSRTRNSLALDIDLNALDILLENLKDMEHFAAFQNVKNQLNDVLKSSTFRAKLNAIRPKMFNDFKNAAAISIGEYSAQTNDINNFLTKVARNANIAAVGFKPNIGFKQLLSLPTFFTEAQGSGATFYPAFFKNLANYKGTIKWAFDNLPLFKKRIKESNLGNEKITNAGKFAKVGLAPNRFFDMLSSALGARSVYDTSKKRYIKQGMSEEQAHNKAIIDAEASYNETQQSSIPLYLSKIQKDKDVFSLSITSFMNSVFSYQRKFNQALRTATKQLTNRNSVIEFEAKRFMQQGDSAEVAVKKATQLANRALRNSFWKMLMYGFITTLVWETGSYAWELITSALTGDDKKRNRDILKEAVWKSAFSSFQGIIGGQAAQNFIRNTVQGKSFGRSIVGTLPLIQQFDTFINKLSNNNVLAALYSVLNLGSKAGLGVDLDIVANIMSALEDSVEGKVATWSEIKSALFRAISAPKSSQKRLVLEVRPEEMPLSGKEMDGKSEDEITLENNNRFLKYLDRQDQFNRYYNYGILRIFKRDADLDLEGDGTKTKNISLKEINQIKRDYLKNLIQTPEIQKQLGDALELQEKIEKGKRDLQTLDIDELIKIYSEKQFFEFLGLTEEQINLVNQMSE
jgi:DNA repair protein RadC